MTEMIDIPAAKEYVLTNYPNDPLLRTIAISLLDKLPKVRVLPYEGVEMIRISTKYGFSICERTINGRWKGQHANWITHWMPLPEPPKEVGK